MVEMGFYYAAEFFISGNWSKPLPKTVCLLVVSVFVSVKNTLSVSCKPRVFIRLHAYTTQRKHITSNHSTEGSEAVRLHTPNSTKSKEQSRAFLPSMKAAYTSLHSIHSQWTCRHAWKIKSREKSTAQARVWSIPTTEQM